MALIQDKFMRNQCNDVVIVLQIIKSVPLNVEVFGPQAKTDTGITIVSKLERGEQVPCANSRDTITRK